MEIAPFPGHRNGVPKGCNLIAPLALIQQFLIIALLFPFLAHCYVRSQDQSQFSNITTQKMIFCLILLSLVSGYVTKRFGCAAVNKTKVIRLNDIHE